MISISVPLPDRAYHVHIGRFPSPADVADIVMAGLTAAGPPTGLAVLVDRTVGERSALVGPLVAALAARAPSAGVVRRYDLAPGESCKSLQELGRTVEWLAAQGFDRGAAVVGVGGAPLAITPDLPPPFICAGCGLRCALPPC